MIFRIPFLVASLGIMAQPVAAACTIDSVTQASDTVSCNNAFSCSGKVIEGCEMVTCSGFISCIGTIIDSTGMPGSMVMLNIDCDGFASCPAVTVIGAKTLDCMGTGSCGATTATDVDDIKCTGFKSCKYLQANSCGIQEGATVHCSGSRSCRFASFTGFACPGEDCDDATLLACPVGGGGDPHLKAWKGGSYDYHGQCDLVLLHAPEFAHNKGLRVHVRTTQRYQYSFIESAAVQVGENILEVGSWGEYYLNGVLDGDLSAPDDFNTTHEQINKKMHLFEVSLREGQKLIIKTHKDVVSVSLTNALEKDFETSVGMMGAFRSGALLARDGVTELEDPNAMGQEWQVLSETLNRLSSRTKTANPSTLKPVSSPNPLPWGAALEKPLPVILLKMPALTGLRALRMTVSLMSWRLVTLRWLLQDPSSKKRPFNICTTFVKETVRWWLYAGYNN